MPISLDPTAVYLQSPQTAHLLPNTLATSITFGLGVISQKLAAVRLP